MNRMCFGRREQILYIYIIRSLSSAASGFRFCVRGMFQFHVCFSFWPCLFFLES